MKTLNINTTLIEMLKGTDTIHLTRDSISLSNLRSDIIKNDISNMASIDFGVSVWNQIDISVIVSIIVFILGFYVNGLIRKNQKRIELKLYKSIILNWWEKSKTTLDDYITSLDKFASEIKKNEDFNIASWRTNLVHVTKLNSLPVEKIADTIIVNLKAKDEQESVRQMMNLLFQLEFIDKGYIEIRAVYDKYCFENQKVMDEWNFYYMRLIDSLQELYAVKEFSEAENAYLDYLHSRLLPKIEKTYQGQFVGISEWSEDFVEPCHVYASNPNNIEITVFPRMINLINLVKGLRIVILKHNKLNDFSHVFSENKNNMIKARNIITESMDYIEKHDIKSFFCIK